MGSALLCITRKNPIACALWLVVTLFALAALFVLLDAQFIAVLQVLVYAGAIMVLFLFVIMLGVAGVLLRRNAIVIFMCVELMLNAVNLTFVALAQILGMGGQVFVFFVMAVAAAEAAVGLAIILAVYRHKQSVSLQNMNLL